MVGAIGAGTARQGGGGVFQAGVCKLVSAEAWGWGRIVKLLHSFAALPFLKICSIMQQRMSTVYYLTTYITRRPAGVCFLSSDAKYTST